MTNFFSKLNWVAVLSIAVAILTQLGNGSMSLAHQLPATWIPGVQEASGNVGSILALIVSAGAYGRVPAPQIPSVPTIVKVLIVAFLLSLFLGGGSAIAQTHRPPLTGNIVKDIENANERTKAAVTGQPAPDSTSPLACTFQMLTKLTPANLLPTINQCIATKLVADTQRALNSAQAFGNTGKGDADAINCLTPALAIFQAGVEIPAVPAQDAVLNPDGTVKTPAVAGSPAQEPGPILLYQKYREFTLSGALTSCQSWFNGPINATAAAGLGAASTVIGGAALLAPLK
jgi:hypothetical protein